MGFVVVLFLVGCLVGWLAGWLVGWLVGLVVVFGGEVGVVLMRLSVTSYSVQILINYFNKYVEPHFPHPLPIWTL